MKISTEYNKCIQTGKNEKEIKRSLLGIVKVGGLE